MVNDYVKVKTFDPRVPPEERMCKLEVSFKGHRFLLDQTHYHGYQMGPQGYMPKDNADTLVKTIASDLGIEAKLAD